MNLFIRTVLLSSAGLALTGLLTSPAHADMDANERSPQVAQSKQSNPRAAAEEWRRQRDAQESREREADAQRLELQRQREAQEQQERERAAERLAEQREEALRQEIERREERQEELDEWRDRLDDREDQWEDYWNDRRSWEYRDRYEERDDWDEYWDNDYQYTNRYETWGSGTWRYREEYWYDDSTIYEPYLIDRVYLSPEGLPVSINSVVQVELISRTSDEAIVLIEGEEGYQQLSFAGVDSTQSIYLPAGSYRIAFINPAGDRTWVSGYLDLGRSDLIQIYFDQNQERVELYNDPDAWRYE